MELFQPFRNAVIIMFEPVRHQNRIAVCCFNDILQCIQLAVMDVVGITGIIVNGTVGKLAQFSGEGCGVGGGDFSVRDGQNQFALQILIPLRKLLYMTLIHLVIAVLSSENPRPRTSDSGP